MSSSMSSTTVNMKRKREDNGHKKEMDLTVSTLPSPRASSSEQNTTEDPKMFTFFMDNTEESKTGLSFWRVQNDEQTGSYIYNRFLELYELGVKINFGDIDQEECVGLVGNLKISSNPEKNKNKNCSEDKKEDEEKEDDEEDEEEEDDEEEEEEEEDEERTEEFQIAAFNEYFEYQTSTEILGNFNFGRTGYVMHQLGDTTVMMSFRNM